MASAGSGCLIRPYGVSSVSSPVAVELRVRRTNWWCGTARDLRTHCHITATIFGNMGDIPISNLNTLINEGTINVTATDTGGTIQIDNYGFIENQGCGNFIHHDNLVNP